MRRSTQVPGPVIVMHPFGSKPPAQGNTTTLLHAVMSRHVFPLSLSVSPFLQLAEKHAHVPPVHDLQGVPTAASAHSMTTPASQASGAGAASA